MAFDFLDRDKHFAALNEELQDEAKGFYDELGEDYCQEVAETYANELADSHVATMRGYVHQADTSQFGNYANIRQDWDVTKKFVASVIEPWGRFDDIVKSIDDETISKEDLTKFQQWCEDWYWTAYGTRWLRYNFATALSEEVAYREDNDDES